MFEPIYGRQNMPLLQSWDLLGRIVLQICRRYATGTVRSGVLGRSQAKVIWEETYRIPF